MPIDINHHPETPQNAAPYFELLREQQAHLARLAALKEQRERREQQEMAQWRHDLRETLF